MSVTMLRERDILSIEKFISFEKNSGSYPENTCSGDKGTAFEKVKDSEPGAFCMYGIEGYNEYALYKSQNVDIYLITFYTGKLAKYYKY